MRYLLLLITLVPFGCATGAEMFRPGERTTAISPEGTAAAEYELHDDGGVVAEVKVWSDGAKRRRGVTVVHVGFEVENLSDEPLRLEPDSVRLVSATIDEGVFRGTEPPNISGDVEVKPRSANSIEVVFTMPARLRPQDLDAFRVHWALSGGVEYAQITPFFEESQRVAAGPASWESPFFDPFLTEPYWRSPGPWPL